MADIGRQLVEDRAMRDAAKRLARNSLATIRNDYEEQGLASRFVQRMKEGADGVLEDAGGFARENPARLTGMVSLGLAALLAYIFRNELLEAIDNLWHPEQDEAPSPAAPERHHEPEPEALSARSDNN